MAISNVLPMLLLLASLFFLPTLRGVVFKDCGKGSSPLDVTSVDVSVKGRASFNISGFTSKTVTGGYLCVKVESHIAPEFSEIYDLCEYTACPMAPGPFVVASANLLPFSAREDLKIHIYTTDSDYIEIICIDFESKPFGSAKVASG